MLIHPLSVVVVAGGSRTCSSISPYISTSARIRVSIKNTNVYRCGIIRIISYYVSSKSKKLVVVVVVVICRAQCNTAYMSYMNSVCVCVRVWYIIIIMFIPYPCPDDMVPTTSTTDPQSVKTNFPPFCQGHATRLLWVVPVKPTTLTTNIYTDKRGPARGPAECRSADDIGWNQCLKSTMP